MGYEPSSWPVQFTSDFLDGIVEGRARAPAEPTVDLVATGSGRRWHVGRGQPTNTLVATQAQLLAWFTGRSDGSGISRESDHPLPVLRVWAI